MGIDVYMPPNRNSHTDFKQPSPRGRIPQGLSIADRMRRKLKTKKGRQIYGLRKELPEPVFGQIKQVRGFRSSFKGIGQGQCRVEGNLYRS